MSANDIDLEHWLPSPTTVNALPKGIRTYIHDLQTICDPQYLIQQIAFLTDQCDTLQKVLVKERRERLHGGSP